MGLVVMNSARANYAVVGSRAAVLIDRLEPVLGGTFAPTVLARVAK